MTLCVSMIVTAAPRGQSSTVLPETACAQRASELRDHEGPGERRALVTVCLTMANALNM
jgi:hypothetical protein